MQRKLIALVLIMGAFFSLKAQQPITLITTDMPAVGNTFHNSIDTVPGNLTQGTSGANQFWDFSSLSPDLRDTVRCVTVSSTGYGSDFPNANLAFTSNDTNYIFARNASAAYKAEGAVLYSVDLGKNVVVKFSPAFDVLQFPATYQTNFKGSYSFTIEEDGSAFGVYRIRIQFTSSYNVLLDSWGIVHTPVGYYEALRERRIDTTRTIVSVRTSQFLPAYTTVSDTRDTTTDYNFYSKESKLALVDFAFDSLGNARRITYSNRSPKPIARFTSNSSGGNTDFTNTTYNQSGTTYSWNFGDGSPNSTQTNPSHTYTANGTYTVCLTATNLVGTSTYCQQITISGVCPTIAANLSATDATCGQPDGEVTANPSGGDAPYTYLWSNTQTTQTITGLVSGQYTVTINDANQCSVVAAANVSNAGAPAISIIRNESVSCFGGSDGAIEIDVTGGTLPYDYSWSNSETTQDISGLIAGNYTVIVEDSFNCQAILSINVAQPVELTATLNVTNITCNSGDDGAITSVVSGGAAPYDYSWSNGDTSQDITGLSGGQYCVSVTDANACEYVACATVTEPDELEVTLNVTDASASTAADGSVFSNISGGTLPYTFDWSDGADTEDNTGVTPDDYTITVTDANGCQATATATVSFSVGTGDLSFAQADWKVYPNPTDGRFYIEVSEALKGNEISVYNMLGAVVYQGTASFQNTIDLSGMSKGIYQVKISSESGALVKRVVLQ